MKGTEHEGHVIEHTFTQQLLLRRFNVNINVDLQKAVCPARDIVM
jgi:hypothetical protein